MLLSERIRAFEILFEGLQWTNSRLVKESLVSNFVSAYPQLVDDWTYILETLDGKHPIGWTFYPNVNIVPSSNVQIKTIKDLIYMCESTRDKSRGTTKGIEDCIGIFGDFLAPIVNRTLRLGIGKSLLSKSDLTPMLAKKYEGGPLSGEFAITEKLDGNRCIASFNRDTGKWQFTSRSGKPMKVDFDMSIFDPDLIYDGEVMSEEQTTLSMKRFYHIQTNTDFEQDTKDAQLLFNRTSGLINRNGNKKGLVYNIFDVVSDAAYRERRDMLTKAVILSGETADVSVLPVLYYGDDQKVIKNLLGRITQMGGEGIMLNKINRGYEHKRSDALLKYKQVQFMDMLVTGFYEGTGKYTGMVGGLFCELRTEDGKLIKCSVGSGLSDAQRYGWTMNEDAIVGKIVQIGYHELTQSEENIGTNVYSLRFPRLIKIRTDKNTTSEF